MRCREVGSQRLGFSAQSNDPTRRAIVSRHEGRQIRKLRRIAARGARRRRSPDPRHAPRSVGGNHRPARRKKESRGRRSWPRPSRAMTTAFIASNASRSGLIATSTSRRPISASPDARNSWSRAIGSWPCMAATSGSGNLSKWAGWTRTFATLFAGACRTQRRGRHERRLGGAKSREHL